MRLQSDRDVARARRKVSDLMKELGATPLMQTRFVTAVSEIARNAVVHGGGGELDLYRLAGHKAVGIECRDNGPGIADIDQAFGDGFSSIGSMGRGLGGAKRLSRELEVHSETGKGTTIRMTGMLQTRR